MIVPLGGTTWATWRRTGPAVRMAAAARPGALLVVAAATVVQGVLPVATAWCTKVLLDDIVQPGPGPARWALAGLLAGALAMTLLSQVRQFSQNELRRGLEVLVQTRLAEAVNRLPGIAQFEQPAFHDQLRLANQAAQSAPGQVVQSGFGLVQGLITLVGFLSTLVVVDLRLAGLALLAGAPGLAAELQARRRRAGLMWRLSPGRRRAAVYSGLQSDNMRQRRSARSDWAPSLSTAATGSSPPPTRRSAAWNCISSPSPRLALAGVVVLAAGMFLIVHDALAGALMVGATAMAIAAFTGAQAGYERPRAGGCPDPSGAAAPWSLRRRAGGDEVRRRRDPVSCAAAVGACPARRMVPLQRRRGVGVAWGRPSSCRPARPLPWSGRTAPARAPWSSSSAGCTSPDRGSIHWDGADLRELDPAALRRGSPSCSRTSSRGSSRRRRTSARRPGPLTNRARIESAAVRSGVREPIMNLRHGFDTLLSRSLFVRRRARRRAAARTCPAASGSGSPLRGRSFATGVTCWSSTSRAVVWTPRPSTGCTGSCAGCAPGVTTLIISHRLRTARQADLIVVLDAGSLSSVAPTTNSWRGAAGTPNSFACRLTATPSRRPGPRQHRPDPPAVVSLECCWRFVGGADESEDVVDGVPWSRRRVAQRIWRIRMKALNALADRLVLIVIPKAEAMAACSGSSPFARPAASSPVRLPVLLLRQAEL